MEATPLASLSLTHVHYNPDDFISYICAWLALVPQALCVIYVTLVWSNREVEILLMFVGQMGCEALNFLLKRIIKEERPKQMNGKGYGMPSSHAQFLAFFSVSLTLFLLVRHKPPSHPSTAGIADPAYYHKPLTFLQRILFSILILGIAAAVAWSRIYLDYHTPAQVLVGCTAGTLSAMGWFVVTSYLRWAGWVMVGCKSWIGRAIRLRDLVIEEDLAEAGWRKWCERQERRGPVPNGAKSEGKKKR